jgi:hypothetical protein
MTQPGFEQQSLLANSDDSEFDAGKFAKGVAAVARRRSWARPARVSQARVGEIGSREPVDLSPLEQAALVNAGMITDRRTVARVQAHQDNELRYGLGGDDALRELDPSQIQANQTGMVALRAAAEIQPNSTQ